MTVEKKDIEHTAHLARVGLSADEQEKLSQDIIKIIDYVETLREVETGSVDLHLTQTHPVINMPEHAQGRTDDAEDSKKQESILSQSPKRKDNFFKVKSVLE